MGLPGPRGGRKRILSEKSWPVPGARLRSEPWGPVSWPFFVFESDPPKNKKREKLCLCVLCFPQSTIFERLHVRPSCRWRVGKGRGLPGRKTFYIYIYIYISRFSCCSMLLCLYSDLARRRAAPEVSKTKKNKDLRRFCFLFLPSGLYSWLQKWIFNISPNSLLTFS